MTHFFRLNEEHFTFHLKCKHSGTFANRKYEELSYLQKSEKVRPHYSQSSPENATPSRGTSPLASYKEVPPQELLTSVTFDLTSEGFKEKIRGQITTKQNQTKNNRHSCNFCENRGVGERWGVYAACEICSSARGNLRHLIPKPLQTFVIKQ